MVSTDKRYKKYITFNCYELYAWFFEHSVNILREGGLLSFITASLYVKGLKFASLRTYLEKHLSLIEYRTQGDDVFKNVQMPTSTIIGRKSNDTHWSCSMLDSRASLANKITKDFKKLQDISKIQRGLEIGRDEVSEKGDFQCLTGTTVDRYIPRCPMYISKAILARYGKDERYFTEERILLRETGNSLLALYLNEHVYSNRSLYSILITDKSYLTKFVLACLNSKLLHFYYTVVYKAETDLFPKIRIAQAKLLPIATATLEKQQTIVNIVDKIISAKRANPQADTSKWERQIDQKVYDIYGLDEAERKLIEEM